MEQRTRWNTAQFLERFDNQISPELLLLVLVEALAVIESRQRRLAQPGVVSDPVVAADIQIDSLGNVAVTGAGSDGTSLVKVFRGLLPDGARVHPLLRKLFEELVRDKAFTPWDARAAVLSYLARRGLAGETFSISHFIEDPLAYNRALVAALAEYEYGIISRLTRRGSRRKATAELHFLLELTPVNHQALELWRAVKQGRRRALGRAMYLAVACALLVASSSVIIEKLGLPTANISTSNEERSQALLIEPADPSDAAIGPGRQPASEMIELSETVQTTTPGRATKLGAVVLDLDADILAYFDGKPESVQAYRDRDVVWLAPGKHVVTVVKRGVPPTVAHIAVRPDRVIELNGRMATAR